MRGRFFLALFFVIIATFSMQACSSIQQMIQGTPSSTPTITPTQTPTRTPTSTPKPTVTFTSTETPNLAATQQYEAFIPLVQEYFDAGYIPSLDGTYHQLGDFSDLLTKDGSYRWSIIKDIEARNFILKSHVTMSTENEFLASTGCGFVFRGFSSWVAAIVVKQGGSVYSMSSDIVWNTSFYSTFSNPAEFDLVLLAFEKDIRAFIDGKEAFTEESPLTVDKGYLGFTVISGSNVNASHCDFKNTELWVIK